MNRRIRNFDDFCEVHEEDIIEAVKEAHNINDWYTNIKQNQEWFTEEANKQWEEQKNTDPHGGDKSDD